MKIQCKYCGNFFDDTNEKCPNCGAPNEGVVRTVKKQPLTIEDLKQWYKDKGLPEAKVTRFFIGENYKGPKAFGIYKDAKTGNFVVYKNKADGTRAVRYEGSDEAYAVNEIFQRLKQEIIQQKQTNAAARQTVSAANQARSAASRQAGGYNKSNIKPFDPSRVNYTPRKKKPDMSGCLGCLVKLIAVPGVILAIATVMAIFMMIFCPDFGYYMYEDTPYCFAEIGDALDHDWFRYDGGETDWTGPLTKAETPRELRIKGNAKHYFVSDDYSDIRGITDFTDSKAYSAWELAYLDKKNDYKVNKGYYLYNGSNYYHYDTDYDDGWYYYDTELDDWRDVDYTEIPEELQHSTTSEDFFYTPEWDSSTQITDFRDSDYYVAPSTSSSSSSSSSSYSSSSSWDWDDDDNYSSSWDWDSSDSWSSSSSDWDSDW